MKKGNMVSATQPKEFIMQHYRDLKAYKDQINANVQCNTLLNSPLQKQIARFHYFFVFKALYIQFILLLMLGTSEDPFYGEGTRGKCTQCYCFSLS